MLRFRFLFALLLLTACGAPDPGTEAIKAQQALAANQFNTARVHVLNALQAEPDNRDYRLLHARIMLGLGDGQSARTSLERLPKDFPSAAQYRALHARALRAAGAPDAAIALFAGVSDLGRLSAEEIQALAWAHYDRGTLTTNYAVITAGLAKYPGDPQLLLLAGRLAKAAGEQDKAQRFAQQALAKGKDDFEVLLFNGEMAIARSDLTAARRHYARAAQSNPDSALPIANVIGIDLDTGQYDTAREALSGAVKKYPQHAFLRFQEARMAYHDRKWKQSRDALLIVEKTLPEFAPAILLSGKLAVAEKRREFALSELGRAQALDPANREAAQLIAQLQNVSN
jgi:Tfp pilus assembly protein PilF